MAMTTKQQWKALRAPVIRELWIARHDGKIREFLDERIGDISIGGVYKMSRYLAARVPDGYTRIYTDSLEYTFARPLALLARMRAAERQGMDPLLWKLTHG